MEIAQFPKEKNAPLIMKYSEKTQFNTIVQYHIEIFPASFFPPGFLMKISVSIGIAMRAIWTDRSNC